MKIKTYFLATRPWSFVVSSASVLVTSVGLWALHYPVNPWLALWATIGIVLFHAAGNVLSDYHDFCQGVDRSDTFGCKTIVDNILTKQQMRRLGIGLFVAASVNGIAMLFVSGWQLLIYGLVGALLTIGYSWMKYHALGDLNILLAYGIVPALGTSFFVTGSMQWDALWFIPTFVTITMAVLHSNNTRDIPTDKRAHICTVPILIGKKASRIVYYAMVCTPILWATACCIAHIMPWWCMGCWLTAPLVMKLCLQMRRWQFDEHAIDGLDQQTAQLQLINCLVIIVCMMLSVYLGK